MIDVTGILEANESMIMPAKYKVTVCSKYPPASTQTGTVNATLAIWYRCLIKIPRHTPHNTLEYTWHEMTFVTRWTPSHCTVVCINTPDTFLSGLEQALSMGSGKLDLSDPYALHIHLMDQIIMLYDESVWGIRDLIRRVEKVRGFFSYMDKTNNG